MKYPLTLLALGTAMLLSLPARAADIDWKKVDAALGKTAAVSGEVHRDGLPRSDPPSRWTASRSSRHWRWADGWRFYRRMARPC